MDEDDRPRRRSAGNDLGAASLLASESLDRYSLEDLDARVAALEAEVVRIRAHRDKASAHLQAAHTLFGPKPT